MEVKGKYYTMKELENMVTMYEQPTQAFIGNKDIEYYTFLTMTLDDLRELVKVNHYLKSIINKDDFWCAYLYKHYNVSYKTECLHIGNALLKNNLSMSKFYQQMIKQKDISVVKFLLDSKLIKDLDYKNLSKITYIPLINVLIAHIEDNNGTYFNRMKEIHIKDLIRDDNINAINQLLKHDRIPVQMIKKILNMIMSEKMEEILLDYINMTKIFFEEMGLAQEFSSSESSSSESSDSDELPRHRPVRRTSPVKSRSPDRRKLGNKSPARRKSPVRKMPKK
jgi:hypothetical protein